MFYSTEKTKRKKLFEHWTFGSIPVLMATEMQIEIVHRHS